MMTGAGSPTENVNPVMVSTSFPVSS